MVTHSREADVGRENEGKMALQMNHKLGTADAFYALGYKINVTSDFRKILKKIVEADAQVGELPAEHSELPVDHDEPPADSPEEGVGTSVPNTPTFTSPETKYSEKKKKRVLFNQYDVKLLKETCGLWMHKIKMSKVQVKQADLASQLNNAKGEHLLKKFSLGQIYTRVRNMVKGNYGV